MAFLTNRCLRTAPLLVISVIMANIALAQSIVSPPSVALKNLFRIQLSYNGNALGPRVIT